MDCCDTYIKSNGDRDEEQVHLIQTVVLLKTVGDKSLLDNINEVEVECGVHDGEDDLFDSIPNLVDVDEGIVDLKASRHPDAENANVDGEKNEEAEPFEFRCIGPNNHQEADSVDDDLNKTLYLC